MFRVPSQPEAPMKKVIKVEAILAQPRGFCAGVVRAIDTVEQALRRFGAPVYVYHEIVHNRYVVEDLRARGAVFVESLSEIPPGAVTIFSAHGVPTAVVHDAENRQLQVVDATCPLVTKVHAQAQRFHRDGYEVIVIGHAGHQEVEGTLGSIGGPAHLISTADEAQRLTVRNPDRVAYVTQTTLSVDDTRDIIDVLKARFPGIRGQDLDDICYATQNRQNAVRALATEVDLLLVVGSVNSSNSNRLRELGAQSGLPAYLINDAGDIDPSWLEGVTRVGITAGASAPEVLVQGVLTRLAEFGVSTHREFDGVHETMSFRLPKPLIQAEHNAPGHDAPTGTAKG